MTAKQAVAERIRELLAERNLKVNAAANSAGISPSTIYSILNTKSKNPGIVTLHAICDGLDISLREFFDSPLFEGMEQAIK